MTVLCGVCGNLYSVYLWGEFAVGGGLWPLHKMADPLLRLPTVVGSNNRLHFDRCVYTTTITRLVNGDIFDHAPNSHGKRSWRYWLERVKNKAHLYSAYISAAAELLLTYAM